MHGVQFVDLDGDGRQDVVVARDNGTIPWRATWRNTGAGFARFVDRGTRGMLMPLTLEDASGNRKGVRFADMDGDGVPDLIADQDTRCNGSCTTTSPVVWFNTQSGWEYHSEYVATPPSWGETNFQPRFVSAGGSHPPPPYYVNDSVADIDGDGDADLIRITELPRLNTVPPLDPTVVVDVLLNTRQGWAAVPRFTFTSPLIDATNHLRLTDVNRDGLPDLIVQIVYQDTTASWIVGGVASPSTTALQVSEAVLLNRGGNAQNGLSFEPLAVRRAACEPSCGDALTLERSPATPACQQSDRFQPHQPHGEPSASRYHGHTSPLFAISSVRPARFPTSGGLQTGWAPSPCGRARQDSQRYMIGSFEKLAWRIARLDRLRLRC